MSKIYRLCPLNSGFDAFKSDVLTAFNEQNYEAISRLYLQNRIWFSDILKGEEE